MARLPVPGADTGIWDETLNEYMLVEHNADGTHKIPALTGLARTLSSFGAVDDAVQLNGVKMVAGSDIVQVPVGTDLSRVKPGQKGIVGGAAAADQITGLRTNVVEIPSATTIRVAHAAQANTPAGVIDGGGANVTASFGTDAGPAAQAAWNYFANRGGHLVVDGDFLLWTPSTRNIAGSFSGGPSLLVSGKAGGSRLIVATSLATQSAITLGGYARIAFEDLEMLGTPFCKTDAKNALKITGTKVFTIDRCGFMGLSTHELDSGVIEIDNGGVIRIRNTRFGGCSASETQRGSVVRCMNWSDVDIDADFIDFHFVNGTSYSKTYLSKAYAWVHILNPAQSIDDGPPTTAGTFSQRAVRIAGNYDEGTVYAWLIQPTTRRISKFKAERFTVNVGYYSETPGTTPPQGCRVEKTDRVMIEEGVFGYRIANPPVAGVALSDAGLARLTNVRFRQNGDRVIADSLCGAVILEGCDGHVLESQAGKTIDNPNLANVRAVEERTVTVDGSQVFDAAKADVFRVFLEADVTSSTVVNLTENQVIEFDLIQDDFGGRTFAFPENVSWLRHAEAGGGGGGAVSSVNGRTGAVTGLAEASDVTTSLATKVDKNTLDANSVLGAVADNTPVAIAVAASRLVGRTASGNIGALTGAEVEDIIGTRTQRDLYLTPGTFNGITVPSWAVCGFVQVLGAGAGAGAGKRRAAAGAAGFGGGGGSGGVYAQGMVAVADFPGAMSVIVGAGGTSGAAATSDGADGGNGGPGGLSAFQPQGWSGTGPGPIIRSRGGNAGSGGTGAAGANGAAPSFGMFIGGPGAAAGAAGGAGVAAATTSFAPGGGSGGGLTSANATSAGGAGGACDVFQRGGGTAGANPGGAGGAGEASSGGYPGTGGGGGGSSTTAAGGAGGAGGRGAGGGGGGAAGPGFNSGPGGVGGDGGVVITWYGFG